MGLDIWTRTEKNDKKDISGTVAGGNGMVDQMKKYYIDVKIF